MSIHSTPWNEVSNNIFIFSPHSLNVFLSSPYLFKGHVQLQVVFKDLNYIRVESPRAFGIHDQFGDAHILCECSDEVPMLLPCGSRDVEIGQIGVAFDWLDKSLLYRLPSDLLAWEVELQSILVIVCAGLIGKNNREV